MIEIFLLSLIQGVTEFLPISSSSHLYLFADYIQFDNQSLSIDVSLHIGSFLAVIIYFYKDLVNFVKNKDLFIKILFASLSNKDIELNFSFDFKTSFKVLGRPNNA